MRDLDDAGPRRDRRREAVDDVLLSTWRHLEADRLDARCRRAARAGSSVVIMRAVVLVGHDDLVAPLQVEAEDHRLVGLGGVARDRHLLGVAAELAREARVRTDSIRGSSTRHMCSTGSSFEKRRSRIIWSSTMRRRGTAAAVVQVDHRAVEVERALDDLPVVLVIGSARAGTRPGGLRQVADGLGRERRRSHGKGADESSAVDHLGLDGEVDCIMRVWRPNGQRQA